VSADSRKKSANLLKRNTSHTPDPAFTDNYFTRTAPQVDDYDKNSVGLPLMPAQGAPMMMVLTVTAPAEPKSSAAATSEAVSLVVT
jgi:hypothetical protein